MIKREERKKRLEIIIDIESRTRPCPPQPKCFLVKDVDSLPCCPTNVVEKLGITRNRKNSVLNRRSSQPNLSNISSGIQQRKITQGQNQVQEKRVSQQFERQPSASHQAEYLNQPSGQKTASNLSRSTQNQSRQSSRLSSAVNTPTPSQQQKAQQQPGQTTPTASQQARLAQQQAAAIQQQMAQLTLSQHEKYIQYHSTMAKQPQPGDQLTSSQHEKWAQYHVSMAQHKKQIQAQQQANAQVTASQKSKQ